MKNLTKSVEIPDIYQPPISQTDLNRKVEIEKQFISAKAGRKIKCSCGESFKPIDMFRCFYCLGYFCKTCAGIHFENRNKISEEEAILQ